MRSNPALPSDELVERLKMMCHAECSLNRDAAGMSELAGIPRIMVFSFMLSLLMTEVDAMILNGVSMDTLIAANKKYHTTPIYLHSTTLAICLLSESLERLLKDYLPIFGETKFRDTLSDPNIITDYLKAELTIEELITSNEKLEEITSGNWIQLLIVGTTLSFAKIAALIVSIYLPAFSRLVTVRYDATHLYQMGLWLIRHPGEWITRNLKSVLWSNSAGTIQSYLKQLALPDELHIVPLELPSKLSVMSFFLLTSDYDLKRKNNYFYEIKTVTFGFNSLAYFCLLQILEDCGFKIMLTKDNSILVSIDKYAGLEQLKSEASLLQDLKIEARKGAKVKDKHPFSTSAIKQRCEKVKKTWQENRDFVSTLNECLAASPIKCELKLSKVRYDVNEKEIMTDYTLIYTIDRRALLAHKHFISDSLRILHERVNKNAEVIQYDNERMIVTHFECSKKQRSLIRQELQTLTGNILERMKHMETDETRTETSLLFMSPPPEARRKKKRKEEYPEVFHPARLGYNIASKRMDETRHIKEKSDETLIDINLDNGKKHSCKSGDLVQLWRNNIPLKNHYLLLNKKSKGICYLKRTNSRVYKKLRNAALAGDLGRKDGIEKLNDDRYWVRNARTDHRFEGRFFKGRTDKHEDLMILYVSKVVTH